MSTTANDRSTVEAARDRAPEGQKVAVVTGAARGIGEAIAQRLGRDGLHVIVADLPSMQEGVASTVEAITSAGGAATAAETDVTEEASVEALVETAVEAGGHLDVFVANAGIAQVQELIDYDAADFQKILDVNVTGVFNSYRQAARAIVDRDVRLSVFVTSAAIVLTGIVALLLLRQIGKLPLRLTKTVQHPVVLLLYQRLKQCLFAVKISVERSRSYPCRLYDIPQGRRLKPFIKKFFHGGLIDQIQGCLSGCTHCFPSMHNTVI